MTDQKLMAIEKERVQNMLQTAMAEIDETGGSVRFFAAAFLVQAFALHVEIEGTNNLQKAMARLGREALVSRGTAGNA